MHQLKNTFGVAYSCSTDKNTYCEDWYTDKYKYTYANIYIDKSLYKLKSLGFNGIRTYYLNPDSNHDYFLALCDNLQLNVEIGISNDLLDTRNIVKITKLITSVQKYNCIKIYTIGNEYFGNIDNIIWALNLVYELDSYRYLMHSSIFDFNFKTAKLVYSKVPNYIKNKYIVGINMYFYSNLPESQGDVLQDVLKKYYNDELLKHSYLIITEYGRNDNNYTALWNFLWGNKVSLEKYEKYLGFNYFSYSDESWKGSLNNENNYGLLTENGDKKNILNAIEDFIKINKNN